MVNVPGDKLGEAKRHDIPNKQLNNQLWKYYLTKNESFEKCEDVKSIYLILQYGARC